MSKLSDTQLVILNAACKRDDHLVLPLPANIKGGAAQKVVQNLIGKALIEEIRAKRTDPVWRTPDDGHGVTLVITDAGLAALGITPDTAPQPATQGTGKRQATKAAALPKAQRAAATGPKGGRTRTGTKQERLINMLRRATGATIAEIMEATEWQAHTVRGAIAGALKKKLGLTIVSEKSEPGGRTYRITE